MDSPRLIKIGLFSTIAQVTIRTLRHYDDVGLLHPAHIDPQSNYRYYTYDQLIRLNQIQALKEIGLSLDNIARLLNDGESLENTLGIIQAKRSELRGEIEERNAQLSKLEARLKLIDTIQATPKYEVVTKSVPALFCASVRRIVPAPSDMPNYRCGMFGELEDWLSERQIEPEQEYVLYHMSEFVESDFDIETAVSVSPEARIANPGDRVRWVELPAAPVVASVVHKGDFMDVGLALWDLFAWIGLQGYSPVGPVREIHLFGRENHYKDLKNIIVELQVPIERNASA